MRPLLPAPREIEALSSTPRAGRPLVETQIDSDTGLPAQGFELHCDATGVRIRAADDAGLRYARACLRQLEDQEGGLPGVRIRDWPDFARRGLLLDVSRDRVPTFASLLELVDLLSALRLNELQLYTEHTFAYARHESVWRDASPLTAHEVRDLDAYCHERGVELVANQNCFGHMELWLRHEAYRPLAERPDAERPACLYPDDDAFAFVSELFDELLPCFRSPRVNINCDETFELGRGRSRARVEERGRGRVYLDFALRIVESLQDGGRHVQMWGDIVREYPELMEALPKENLTLLAWGYEAPLDPESLPGPVRDRLAQLGVVDDRLRGFAPHLRPFDGHEFYVCPGTSSWNALVGRWPNARENLLDAAESGRAAGAHGYLITDWGDNGHLQPPCVSLPALAYGAAVGWCADANRDLDVADALARHVLPAEGAGHDEAGALLTLGSLYPKTGLTALNATAIFQALLRPQHEPLLAWGEVNADGLQAVSDEISAVIEATPGDGRLQRELRQAARLARHGAWRLARRHHLPCPGPAALHADLSEAIREQAVVWAARSRPGGLDDSLARLRVALDDYV